MPEAWTEKLRPYLRHDEDCPAGVAMDADVRNVARLMATSDDMRALFVGSLSDRAMVLLKRALAKEQAALHYIEHAAPTDGRVPCGIQTHYHSSTGGMVAKRWMFWAGDGKDRAKVRAPFRACRGCARAVAKRAKEAACSARPRRPGS